MLLPGEVMATALLAAYL